MNRLAILSPGRHNEPTLIAWHDTATRKVSHSIPGVADFSAIKLTGASGTDIGFSKSGLFPAGKSTAAALRHAATLEGFLGSELIDTAEWALCEITRPSGWPNVSIFVPIKLGGYSGRVYLKGASGLAGSIKDYKEITITTGPCLFSRSVLKAVTSDNEELNILQPKNPISKLIRNIASDPELSLYELESVHRLTATISGLLTTLPKSSRVSITLDVPQVQYYFYLLDAFAKGFVDKVLLRRWFDLVDERHQLIVSKMKHQLLQTSGIRGYSFQSATSMNSLAALVRERVELGKLPSASEIAAVLIAGDQLWSIVLHNKTIQNYLQLVNLSYTVEQLHASQWRTDGTGQRLGVAIENYNERLTLRRTMQIVREIRKLDSGFRASLLGLFPKEAIFNSQVYGATNLYFHNLGTRFMDAVNGRHYSAPELISAVYGLNI